MESDDRPARLSRSKRQRRCSRVIQSFGGQPEIHLTIRANDGSDDGKTQHFDDYPGAAMSEMVALFHRTRRSVCRCQMLPVGNGFLIENPDILNEALRTNVKESFFDLISEQFWEQAETAYIRIASYWDRVGQMLDFVFFNIRQFERDGFTAVHLPPYICTIRRSSSKSPIRRNFSIMVSLVPRNQKVEDRGLLKISSRNALI
jgi:hypothetical protein